MYVCTLHRARGPSKDAITEDDIESKTISDAKTISPRRRYPKMSPTEDDIRPEDDISPKTISDPKPEDDISPKTLSQNV